MPKTVAFCTLGCKVNQYDSQAMLEQLMADGYESVHFSEKADVYVINTCTVTGTGDQKSRQMIRRAHAKNPEATVVVTGCLAQRSAELLSFEGVRLIIGTQRRKEIVALLAQALQQETPLIAVAPLENPVFEELRITNSEGRTRAALKIQEGCDNHCSYCIIPSVRGAVRSRSLAEIAKETQRLADAGYAEIVLTGIHLASYGKDFGDGTTLLDAIEKVHAVEGVRRIRLGSLEPVLITADFVQKVSEMPKVCPQFMLALQSGSDTVLARMQRRYTTAMYQKAVMLLRQCFPGAAITTDVMTGFPGETEEEFLQTLFFVKEIGFSRIHVFPYSEREGTKAAAMPHAVPKALREERASRLIAVGKELEAAYLAAWPGKTVEVLFEEPCEGGAQGYTAEYVRVTADGSAGKLQRVHVHAVKGGMLMGKLVPPDA